MIDQDKIGVDSVDVILTGGPSDLPDAVRTQRLHRDEYKVKVLHRGGYEHFERDPSASDTSGPLVFQWTMRTHIAE